MIENVKVLLIFPCLLWMPVLLTKVSVPVVDILAYITDEPESYTSRDISMNDTFDGNEINGPSPVRAGRNITKCNLVCNSSVKFEGCKVEFLIDQKTAIEIRMFNNSCYSTKGLCEKAICSCSDNCSSFKWTFNSEIKLEKHTFRCGGQVEDQPYLYNAYISTIFDGKIFHPMTEDVQLIEKDMVNPLRRLSEQERETKKTGGYSSVIILIICGISLIAVLIVLFFVIVVIKNKKRIRKRNNQSLNVSDDSITFVECCRL